MHAALACRDFAEVVPQARRSLPPPTRLDLLRCDLRQPDFCRVLFAFGRPDAAASPSAVTLRDHYEKAAKLQQAKHLGVATALQRADGCYTGEVSNGQRHGFGFWAGENGRCYEGEFRGDKFHGHGVYMADNGMRYEGEFRDHMLHGHGIWVGTEGTRYEGGFKNCSPHGHGMWVGVDGTRYEGEHKDGK